MSEEYRSNFFLVKLQLRLNNKILSIGKVSVNREEIYAMAIMQERVLDRSRYDGGYGLSSKSSGGQNSKGKSLEFRVLKLNKFKGNDDGKLSYSKDERSGGK